ncbi:S8 family peptidase [Actinophytocola sp. NPDC049390]|uniref:S8 family peptidase n=1 Tax=Actinophytocola sp. NPDC049390 TaxID=3363894 RepID=UPI00378DA3DF
MAVSAAGVTAATASPAVAQDGPAAHFVVLGPQHGSLGNTEASIRAAGGEVLQSWPQIGVVIATSTSADFASEVRGKPGVAGAGASRNLAELDQAAARSAGASEQQGMLAEIDAVATAAATAPAAGAVAAEPLEANQWGVRAIRSDQANAISGGSRSVLVGVLDSGIDPAHPDLAPNLDASKSVGCTDEGVPDTSPAAWAPTTSSHGTHVAGTIAAARNGIGVAGVAPNVRLASVKVVDDNGFIYPEYAICGFVWAAENGIDVTNNSYFIDPWFLWCKNDTDQAAVIEAVRRAVDYSARNDVVNVAALGNSNWDLSHEITDTGSPNNGTPVERTVGNECLDLPAELPGFVGVSAIGPEIRKSFYSNYGVIETDVAAPGGDSRQVADTPSRNGRILSTIPGGGYGYSQGTSMASPHAAGVVALIRSTHQDWSAPKVQAALGLDADRLPCPEGVYDPDGSGAFLATCQGGPSGTGFYGLGVVDALDAVTR